MNLKLIFPAVLTVLIAALPTGHADEPASGEPSERTTLLACWDQTFFYNVFRIEETSQHYFVSLSGAKVNIGDNPVYLANNSETFSIETESSSIYGQTLTKAFVKDECSWDASAKTLSCKDTEPNHSESIYLTRTIDNLGEEIVTISPFKAAYGPLELNASSSGMSLDAKDANGNVVLALGVQGYVIGSEPPAQLDCSLSPSTNNAFLLGASVPQKLIDFLENI